MYRQHDFTVGGEKGRQVGMMGKIYAAVDGVLGWLDEDLPFCDGEKTFAGLECLSRRSTCDDSRDGDEGPTATHLELLLILGSAQCQDPRDLVFALSSLFDNRWPQPDYALGLSELWIQCSWSCIEHGPVMLLLSLAAKQKASRITKGQRMQRMPPCLRGPMTWRTCRLTMTTQP